MKFNATFNDDGMHIVVINDAGAPEFIGPDHEHYARIGLALFNGEDPTQFLDGTFVPEYVAPKIESLSARVSVHDDVVHFDGEPVHNAVADTIVRYRQEDRDPRNIVRFMERLSSNPSESSRNQLFNWTQAQSLTIDRDGYIIGYKGVSARTDERDHLDANGNVLFPLDRYPYQSCSGGHGIVDGHEINGHLPMGVGVTVEMPRGEVNEDPNMGCSTGLHVGDFDYAKGYAYAGALLEVRFDPADVVSVPADCNFSKLRCCRYEGAAIHDLSVGDDLSAYEPDAAEDEAMEAFVEYVPDTLRQRVRNFLRIKKNKGGGA